MNDMLASGLKLIVALAMAWFLVGFAFFCAEAFHNDSVCADAGYNNAVLVDGIWYCESLSVIDTMPVSEVRE